MPINEYLKQVNTKYKAGNATEHTYRGYLQALIESLAKGISATNEPTRISCGAPDYIITNDDIPVGYIEAKDIGKQLDSKEYKEQFDRYKTLPNLIITDYLEFRVFVEGEFTTSIRIADVDGNKIVPKPENFVQFTDIIRNFCAYQGQTIISASKLSKMMADRARMLEQIIEAALLSDEESQENTELRGQMQAFKSILIHDITPKGFADIYAQTIAYGMFAARLHDPTLEDFSRREAAELIPKSNPFLRKLFQYIAGYDLDTRIVWIVDALAGIFRATDMTRIMRDFGRSTQRNDPIIHFYETFLSKYDPNLRKSRGVWYTPEPVVNFIVRAVDDILKTEFELPQGLADTSKTKITLKQSGKNNKKTIEHEMHKVQILDPATGTGTFLAEVIKQVHSKFEGQEGIWGSYVTEHLIPRLNGFEILMASYAMAHLKLELLLKETGYQSKTSQRLQVYLTNSLEEFHPTAGQLPFQEWLTIEADEASKIKRDTPVMVVIGNPPYSVSSSNKSPWIENLMQDYKKDLNERNIQPLSDDYIKFIRFGQYFVEKNGEGILAYISNNSFIDGLIHRQMRKNLLETFDKIYIVDLHGNSNRKETAPDGDKDDNVFDIQQGVSINLFVKTGNKKKKELAQVYHIDLYGKRDEKYNTLWENNIQSLKWKQLDCQTPDYFFVPKDFDNMKGYNKGFSLNELFPQTSTGVETGDDETYIKFIENDFENNIFENTSITPIEYRPFDQRFCYYNPIKLRRAAFNNFKNLVNKTNNICIAFPRQTTNSDWSHIQVTKFLFDNRAHYSNKGRSLVAPLYLYPDTKQQTLGGDTGRVPNLDMGIVEKIAKKLKLTFTPEKETTKGTFAPIDVLDYIYAILHSPSYRERYKEFLKIDFPRVPYPTDAATFWELVRLGGELRQIHLLESSVVTRYITSYPVSGSNEVEKIRYESGKVWINDTQYFDKVPQTAWEFYIGGYQPAQKWLKDRRGRTLSFDDILHYQQIIVALSETDRIMREIDEIAIEEGR